MPLEQFRLQRYGPLDVEMPPFDEEGFLMVIPDEECSQAKGLNYLWDCDIVGLNGCTDPEGAHPRWRAVNRSMDRAKLRGAVMKATTICNWKRGPFLSGQNEVDSKEALRYKLRDSPPEWFESNNELVAGDKNAEPKNFLEEMKAEWYAYLDAAWIQTAPWNFHWLVLFVVF
jgi:hypothetical protein